MFVAGLTFVGASVRIFGRSEITEVLELIIFLHVVVNRDALPMSSLELAMFGALFGNLDFIIGLG